MKGASDPSDAQRSSGGLNGGRVGEWRQMAERVGFEPTVRFPVHCISSAAHSTTLPPLREVFPVRANPLVEAARLAKSGGIAKPLSSRDHENVVGACLFRLLHRPIFGG